MTTGILIESTAQLLGHWRGGTTRAIYADPPEGIDSLATAHAWVGTAVIERDCAYSTFPNRTRIHLPIRGNGLQLHFQQPSETIALPTFAQTTFAGDRPLNVRLNDGPVEAFNLIFHPTVQADIQLLPVVPGHDILIPARLSSPPAQIADQTTLAAQVLYAIDGVCLVETGSAQPVTLQPGDAFVRRLGPEFQVTCAEQAGALVIATLVWSLAK